MSDPGPTTPTSAQRRKGVFAASVGTIVEYYDLTVYAYLAVVLGPLFFPGEDPTASLLASLAVFASAYLVRPIGGIVLGRMGDRHGRKRALFVSVVLMGVGSLMMALLPTYETVGIVAPILLVLARLMQGFSAGGELGGALTFVYESAREGRKGFASSFVTLGSSGGFALAAVSVGTVTALTTDEQMSSWGWRVPFILGVPLLIFCLWLRARIDDTTEFEKTAHENKIVKAPLSYTLRNHPGRVAQVFGFAVAQSATGYMVMTYMAIYLVREGGYEASTVAWLTALVIVVGACINPLIGLLVDRVGSPRVIGVGLLWCAVTAYPAMTLMVGHGLLVAGVAFFIFSLGAPLIQTGNAPLLPSLFKPEIRLTGVAFGFNIATCVAGGTAAYISTWLIDVTGNSQSPAFFIITACIIGGTALISRIVGSRPAAGNTVAASTADSHSVQLDPR